LNEGVGIEYRLGFAEGEPFGGISKGEALDMRVSA
jgi:hypothetical protein